MLPWLSPLAYTILPSTCRGAVSINLIRDLIKKNTEFWKSTMNETGVDQKTISSKYLEMDDFSLQQREKTEWKCEREKGTGKNTITG